jgi:hypothetical protein
MELFSPYKLKSRAEEQSPQELLTFNLDKETTSERVLSDMHFRGAAGGGVASVPFELSQTPADELALIGSYRDLAAAAEVDEALQEIRNEILIFDVPEKKAIEIDFKEETEISEGIRKKIAEEYDYLYELIDFDSKGIQWFDDWYVDAKLYLHKIIDKKKPKLGIQKVSVIDPLKIRLVRILPMPNPTDGTYDMTKVREVFIYSAFDPRAYPLGQTIQLNYGVQIQGLQIDKDQITYINSGKFDRNLGQYVGYLKKAIVPYNNLKMMEEAMVIFRIVRAPARRAFYVDVSGLQKNKAEAYMKDLMGKFRSKMVYDTKTGTLADKRSVLSMMEDYWLPRRNGERGTEVQTIEGQQSQDILEEVTYLRDKLWRALGVPRSRFGDQPQTFQFGKGIEIQRDEYRFAKYLQLLRSRFVVFLEDLLRTQLILKNIITASDWDEIKGSLAWQYTEDNAFVEYKEAEILNNRVDVLTRVDPLIGKYYSRETIMKTVLRMTDEDIQNERKRMDKERDELPDLKIKAAVEEQELNQ